MHNHQIGTPTIHHANELDFIITAEKSSMDHLLHPIHITLRHKNRSANGLTVELTKSRSQTLARKTQKVGIIEVNIYNITLSRSYPPLKVINLFEKKFDCRCEKSAKKYCVEHAHFSLCVLYVYRKGNVYIINMMIHKV